MPDDAAADLDAPPPWARPPGDGRPPIRTIGPQRGRLERRHAEALDRHWDRFVVDAGDAAARIAAANRVREPEAGAGTRGSHGFPHEVREAARASAAELPVLDVAMGDGATTVALAAAAPEVLHVAVDVHRPGIAQLLRRLDELDLSNVLVVAGDVWDLLPHVPDGALAAVQCCFPDPWPKRRHHARRLVTARWVGEVARTLAPGGELRLATDWPDYAEQMRAAVRADPRLHHTEAADGWSPRFAGRPETTYERRGLAAGRPPRDIRATRLS